MRSNFIALNKLVKRWNTHLGTLVGIRLEPQILIVAVTILVLFIQSLFFVVLSTKNIYCHLPNMRYFYISRSTPSYEELPIIYVITPTYSRHVQKAELTRLSHTLMLVPKIHWIIVEDSERQTDSVLKFARRLRNEFDFQAITILHEPTPPSYKLKAGDPDWKYPKGVWQRNRAIRWLRDNLVYLDHRGVVYFADDDNTYDLELFNEMRYTARVSVWPVGLVGGLLVERPIVDSDKNRVKSFNSMWEGKRPFPLDMAGFALSLRLLMSRPDAHFSAQEKIGYVESHFLGLLVKSWDELEPKADRCSKVLVWHTKTKLPALHEERKLAMPSNGDIEW